MKIIEEININSEDNSQKIRFIIIGDKKEGSLEVPLWEKSIIITDQEKVQLSSSEALKIIKRNNAVTVFEKFYNDIYSTNL